MKHCYLSVPAHVRSGHRDRFGQVVRSFPAEHFGDVGVFGPGDDDLSDMLAAVLSLGIASILFSNRDRGYTPSQWLMAGFIWVVLMVLAYVYQRIF